MRSGPREVRDVRRGERITQDLMNEPRRAIRDLQRLVAPKAATDASPRPSVDEDNPEALPGGVEVWTFVSSVTETVRIEDADDSDVYVDVEKTLSVTVQRPDGSLVRIELE